MKKITVVLAMFICSYMYAQQQCAVLCHNGDAIRVVNTNAINGHLIHGDLLISNDCDYEIIGNECDLLSVTEPEFHKAMSFNKNTKVLSIKEARYISIYNMAGQKLLYKEEDTIYLGDLPINVYLLRSDKYVRKIVLNNYLD